MFPSSKIFVSILQTSTNTPSLLANVKTLFTLISLINYYHHHHYRYHYHDDHYYDKAKPISNKDERSFLQCHHSLSQD